MQTLGRLPMQSSDGRDLCQKGLTVTSALGPSLTFYLWKETMSHPPSSFALTDSSGSERPWSTLHLGVMADCLWLSVASLDCYKRTR
jgi:hypothetical protein